jgi:predicted signal transduction protein with EAL and GGDEF domain
MRPEALELLATRVMASGKQDFGTSRKLHGLVFPDEFVGVAEDNGLIDDLARVVLIAARQQARRWRNEGLMLRVAVNVSMNNLTRLYFADFVLGEVVRCGVPAEDLILEVTESRNLTCCRWLAATAEKRPGSGMGVRARCCGRS